MSDDARNPDDADRRAILRRRNRLIALALSGAALGASGCEADPVPCLEPVFDGGGSDASPTPCLSDSGPLILDAGLPADAAPTPCLDPLPDDGGPPDGAPGDGGADAG